MISTSVRTSSALQSKLQIRNTLASKVHEGTKTVLELAREDVEDHHSLAKYCSAKYWKPIYQTRGLLIKYRCTPFWRSSKPPSARLCVLFNFVGCANERRHKATKLPFINTYEKQFQGGAVKKYCRAFPCFLHSDFRKLRFQQREG